MNQQPISGILNVDKPLGWTSHDVVGLVRRLAGQRQVGHAGTLDPLATGVLLVVLGQATRLSDDLMHGSKCYLARVRLGTRTNTDDAEGEVVETRPTGAVTREGVIAALRGLCGDLQQVPPAYAAIKQGGVPAYKLARQGKAPEQRPRAVRIEGVALVAMEGDVLDVLVWCGAGTYIRALARDLGASLGCGAHLAALRRLSSGAFAVDTASGVEDLRRLAAAGRLRERVRPMDEAVASWPALVCDAAATSAVLHGNAVAGPEPAVVTGSAGFRPVPGLDGGAGNMPALPVAPALPDVERARLYARDGRLLALARYDAGRGAWQPYKVLAAATQAVGADA